jgi:hypothetical protein
LYDVPKQYTLAELLLDCEELLIDDDDTELLLDCEELLIDDDDTELLLCPGCDEEVPVAEEDVFPEEIPGPLSPELSGF